MFKARPPSGDSLKALPTRRTALPAAGLLAVLCLTAALLLVLSDVHAQSPGETPTVEVPSDWSLIPSGLGVGDSFRLIFLSSTQRNAESTDINVYNSFVQDLARAGHTDIEEHASLFRAVVCTSAVNAINNTGTTGTGVPVHWLGGAKAADDYADFYDGTWDEEATVRDESGASVTIPLAHSTYEVWAGCENDGTEGMDAGESLALGVTEPGIGQLNPAFPNAGPLDLIGSADPKASLNYLYGLSPVFLVAETPRNGVEVPSDWSLIPSGLGVGDSFRLIFLSSTQRNAESTDINVYNSFVQDLARAGHTDIEEHASLFRAVVCTSAVNAINNTGTTGTGVPVHWLGGAKAADDYADFYDGTWDEEATVRDESGASVTIPLAHSTYVVWAGCENDGTEGMDAGESLALGVTEPGIGQLNPAFPNAGPLDLIGSADPKASLNYLYGLSPVFLVGTGVTPPKRVTGFDLNSDNTAPTGVTGNANTIWVSNDGGGATDKLFAYKRSDGSRDSGKDFNTLDAAGNNRPSGVCTDGTTMYVADSVDDKAYAYKLSDKTRDSSKDISFASGNDRPEGLWCNTTMMWVTNNDDDSSPGDKVFAYKLSDGSRESGLDLNIQSSPNDSLRGLWSNGSTMFVADWDDDRVYAHRMSDGTRDEDKDISLGSANANANGMWFDGRVLWVADTADQYLYAHDLPGATGTSALLSGTLTVDIQSTIARGYVAAHATNPGSLSSTTFVLDGTKYTVTYLFQNDLLGDPLLRLSVEPKLDPVPSGVFLVLDNDNNDEFELTGAGTTTQTATGTNWRWPIPSITWEANDSFSVTIRQDGNTAATGAPTVGAGIATTEDVWASTLTAGSNAIGVGYLTELDPDVGSLSPSAFTVDGVTYTVKNLYDNAPQINDGALIFFVDEEIPRDFTLWVGGEPFSSTNANEDAFATDYKYTWDSANLSWSANDTLPVVLSVYSPPALGVEQRAPEVGETLTADTSAIADADGLDDVLYHYQWVRVDGSTETDIAGTTGETYTPGAADVGKKLKVRVVFDDDKGFKEYPKTSLPSVTVPCNAIWCSTMTVGGGVGYDATADPVVGSLDDDDFTDQGTDYVVKSVTQAQLGLVLLLDPLPGAGQIANWTLTVEDDDGFAEFALADASPTIVGTDTLYVWANPGLSWSDGDEVFLALRAVNTPATGAPTIIGPPQAGHTLTADTSGIIDEDGKPDDDGGYGYQWIASEGGTDTDIDGADGQTYTLTASEAGQRIKVRVSFTDGGGSEETLTSAAMGPVAAASATSTRLWAGTVTVGAGDYGRGYSATVDPVLGSLDDDDFTDQGTAYVVKAVIRSPAGLVLLLDPSPGAGQIAAWTLTVDNGEEFAEFPLADASPTASGTDTFYIWANPGLSWSDGDEIFLALKAVNALVSNTGQRGVGVTGLSANFPRLAQGFTTGANDEGYTLSSIGLEFDDIGDLSTAASGFTATLNEASGSNPGDVLCTLDHPSSYASFEVNTYDAPSSGCPTLTASTTYFIVLQRTDTSVDTTDLVVTDSTDEDATSAPEWSIANARHLFGTADGGSWQSASSGVIKIEVRGAAVTVDFPATGQPTVSGTAAEGNALGVDVSGIEDGNGIPEDVVYSYQWQADGVAIVGAEAPTYWLAASDIGKRISVQVTFTDSDGYVETLTSARTVTVTDDPTLTVVWSTTITAGVITATGLSGFTKFENTLGSLSVETFDVGGNRHEVGQASYTSAGSSLFFAIKPDLSGQFTLAYGSNDKFRSGDATTSGPSIFDASFTAYVWDMVVTSTHSEGEKFAVAVMLPVDVPPTGKVTIDGAFLEHEVLTANTSAIEDANGLAGVSYSYQWGRSNCPDSANDGDITGATAKTYTLTATDETCVLSVTVTFEDDAGFEHELTANAERNPAAVTVTLVVEGDNVTLEYFPTTLALTVQEEAGAVRLGLRAVTNGDSRPAAPFQITVQSQDDDQDYNAEAGLDYQSFSQTYFFAPSSFQQESGRYVHTVWRTLSIVDDAATEKSEEFLLQIDEPSHADVTLAHSEALVFITDSDVTTLSLTCLPANEGEPVTFTIMADKPVAFPFTVTVSTVAGTAVEGDYTKYGAVELFTSNQVERTFTIATTEDINDEGDKTFEVVLDRGVLDDAILIGNDRVTCTIRDNGITPPGAPRVTPSPRDRGLFVTWTVPEDGGRTTDKYQVQWKGGGREFSASYQHTVDSREDTISNLGNGAEYLVRVRASNNGGADYGAWSRAKEGTPQPLPVPTGFTALWPSRSGDPPIDYYKTQNSLTVSWFVVRGADEYQVEYRRQDETGDWTRVNGYFDRLPSTTRGHRPVAVATGLDCDTRYSLRVRARNQGDPLLESLDGWTPYASTQARTGPCALPEWITNVLVTLEPQCADLSWTAPSGGQPSGYQIQRYLYDTPNEALETIEEDTGSAAATYSDCSQEYRDHEGRVAYYITALGAEGFSVTSILSKGSFEQPEPPRNVRLTQDTQFVRRLEWDQAHEAWRTTVLASREGRMRNSLVTDPWTTWYQVERREFTGDPEDDWSFPAGSRWEVMRSADDKNTSRTYTDSEDRGSRLYVYRVIPHNSDGAALEFRDDWAFDGPTYTLPLDNVQGDDQQQDPAPTVAEEVVWSADMLVVEYTSVSIGAATADLFSNEGGSAGLQVKSLWSYKPDRDLRLAFEEGVPARRT